jgi:ribosomal-protein-alanine N-acetyltransferase
MFGRMAAPRLSNFGLVLRPFNLDDAQWVSAAYSDPAMRRWHRKDLRPLDAAAAWVKGQAESDVAWAVAEAANGYPLGQVALRALDRDEDQAMCGYWVVPEQRGRGVAGRALSILVAHAFKGLRLHRLELTHSVKNTPSCSVALKAGFELEGTKRSQLRHGQEWHDMHLHARIADDA